MDSPQKLYNFLPYPFKTILVNLIAFKNYKSRYSSRFKEYFKSHLELWYSKSEILEEYQKNQLSLLLEEAYLYTPWYSKKMKSLGISLNHIKTDPIKVLNLMAILTKAERKSEVENLTNSNPKRKTISMSYTSGTSGSPTKNYLDKESIERSFAIWKRFHHVIGIKKRCKNVRFSGRIITNPKSQKAPFWIYNYFEKQLLMSTYHLSDKNIDAYLNKLKRFKPELLDGYPSAFYILATYINRNHIDLNFKPIAIAVTAETLYDYQRNEIEQAFGCKVYNQYASSEGSPFITECCEGNLHLNLDTGIFEFINTEGNIGQPGQLAQLVVTSFRNFKNPLIRYNIEDNVLLPKTETTCTCGCSMPTVERIIGREDDILWTKEKGYVGRIGPVYKGLFGLTKSQIIQDSPDKVIVNYIINDKYTDEMEKTLIANLRSRLGEKINIKLNKVNEIPLGPNGKYDAVKRNFKINL